MTPPISGPTSGPTTLSTSGFATSGGTTDPPRQDLGTREVLLVAVVGLLCAVLGFGIASAVLAFRTPHYRAEMQLALLPGPQVPPQELADSWEALSRGQAARIAAEVLGQRRWRAAAAQSAGVPAESIQVTAGAIADTSLIELGVEANSPQAAERAGESLVREARPVVEQVSGLFVLEILQPAEGTAKPVGTSPGQLLAVAGVAGLLLGSGGALMVLRHRGARRTTSSSHRDARPSDPFPARYPDERAPRGGRPPGGGPNGGGPNGGGPNGGVPSGGVSHGGEPPGVTPNGGGPRGSGFPSGGLPGSGSAGSGPPGGAPNGVGLTHRAPPWPGSAPLPPVPPSTSTPTRR